MFNLTAVAADSEWQYETKTKAGLQHAVEPHFPGFSHVSNIVDFLDARGPRAVVFCFFSSSPPLMIVADVGWRWGAFGWLSFTGT